MIGKFKINIRTNILKLLFGKKNNDVKKIKVQKLTI
jgi:hypothetical protein